MELVVAKPGTGHSVDGGRGHRATEGAAGAESDVIEQDQHDVGCVDRGPVCAERYRFDSSRRRPIEPVKGGVGPGR